MLFYESLNGNLFGFSLESTCKATEELCEREKRMKGIQIKFIIGFFRHFVIYFVLTMIP